MLVMEWHMTDNDGEFGEAVASAYDEKVGSTATAADT
jgi:hypothetical protein